MVNLRANTDGKISSIGYQKQGMLPICTPIEISEIDSDEIAFTNSDNGIQYVFELHDQNKIAISKHLDRIIGDTCLDQSAMSEVDKTGISQGKATVGMTKEGVIAALGYPPEHQTPSTRGDTWIYWSASLSKFKVTFKNNVVVSIK